MWFLALCAILTVFSVNVAAFDVPDPFGCQDSLISDEWRKYVLNFHNTYRRRLAEKDGGVVSLNNAPAPAAKKMNELVWDCTIEQYAYENACTGNTDPAYGKNLKKVSIKKTCNATEQARDVLKEWWNEIKKIDLSAAQTSTADVEHFALMAHDQAQGFACTHRACTNSELTLLCLYDKTVPAGNVIYEKANAPAEICECNPAAQDDCVAFLCQTAYTPVEDIPARACSADDGMTGTLEAIATDMHNYYRRLVATGWAVDKKGGYAPTAKAMPQLEYDCTTGANNLAAQTKAIVDGCPSTTPSPSPGRSLNYYYVRKYDVTRAELLEEAITKWAKEVSEVGVGKDNLFKPDSGITNYANMMNDQVDKFACAVEVCTASGASAVACQYNGLTPDEDTTIYTIGTPCKCPTGRKCSPLLGVCVVSP